MKHLRIFESFIREEQMMNPMDPGEFDPMKFKVASNLFTNKIGKPVDDGNMGFPEIKEVFGRDDYNLRFMIAQALHLIGRNYFPTNKYFGKDIQTKDKEKGDLMVTYYVGESPQNMLMKKIGKGLLTTIKPLVMKIAQAAQTPQQFSEYLNWQSPKIPDVIKTKALVDKLPKTEFPM
jgi:hypothetical protein